MTQNSRPLSLISVSRGRELSLRLEEDLAPNFRFPIIVHAEAYSPETVRVLFNVLNPSAAGVIVGGGLSLEVQQEVEKVVQEQNAAKDSNVKLVCIPVGIGDRVSAAEVLEWVKDALSKEFDVSW